MMGCGQRSMYAVVVPANSLVKKKQRERERERERESCEKFHIQVLTTTCAHINEEKGAQN